MKEACRRKPVRRGAAAAVCAALLIFAGCSGEPPLILEAQMRPAVVQDRIRDRTHLELNLFLNVRDPDGLEDLETVYLIHDDAELYWTISADEWTAREQDDQWWIAATELVTEDYGVPPSGGYRLLLLDAAGERDETELFLSADLPEPRTVSFPEVRSEAGTLWLDSPYSWNDLWLYTETGELAGTMTDVESGSNLTDLFSRRGRNGEPASFFIRASGEGGAFDIVAGPFYPD